jgi:CheY-like chemotaxis protein
MMTLAHDDQEIEKMYPQQQGQMESEAGVGVLVVDDDRAIREALRLMLEDANYPVADVADGVAALDVLRHSTRPLVVLLDLVMPHLDGIGVLRAIGQDRRLATCHAYIVSTANIPAFTPTLTGLLSQVDADVLRKPFDMDVLLDAIDRAARRLTGPTQSTDATDRSYAGHSLYH